MGVVSETNMTNTPTITQALTANQFQLGAGHGEPGLGMGVNPTSDYFDFLVKFGDGELGSEFDQQSSITLKFTSSVSGLDAADFLLPDATGNQANSPNGIYYLGADIEDGSVGTAGGGASISTNSSGVPDAASTAMLLGMAMIGVVGLRRKLSTATV
jgi:hypothetical protein